MYATTLSASPAATVLTGFILPLPSLMISITGGLIVTRASSDARLGAEFKKQIFSNSQPLLLAGGVLILACQYFANSSMTIYAKSDYWLDSPAQVLTKVGVLLLMVAFAFVWTRYGAGPGWSAPA